MTEINSLINYCVFVISLGICLIFMVKKRKISKEKNIKSKGNVITILLLCTTLIANIGNSYSSNIDSFNVFNYIGYNVLNVVSVLIQFFTYKSIKNNNFDRSSTTEVNIPSSSTIKELMIKSGLTYNVCSAIYDISLDFLNCENEIAKSKIDTLLIPILKSENSLGNVGIAFGMLIGDNRLSKKEAINYSNAVISEMVLESTN